MQGSESIRLKLLAQDNVILIKCAGFDTEIFMPTIIDGRLSLINVVPQRRQCKCISTNLIVAKKVERFHETHSETISNWHLSRDLNSICETSTPEQLRCATNKQRPAMSRMQQLNDIITPRDLNSICQTSTPEQLRCAPNIQRPAISKTLQFDNIKTSPKQQRSLPSLDQSTAIQAPLNVLTEDNSSTNSTTPLGSLSSFEWTQNSFMEEENEENISFISSSLPALPRWREKVLTPIRTYSRQKYTPSHETKNVHSNKLTSHTEGIKPQKTIIKLQQKNYTKIDEFIKISPKTFKRQLEYKSAQELYREIRQEHKDRENEITKKTAYELFTTPTLQSCFSQKLKSQFRTRCQNKAASTYPKYKNLAKIETIFYTQKN